MTAQMDLKGLWEGTYNYSSSLDSGDFPFKIRMACKDGVLSGMVIEKHVHADHEVRAEIKGRVDGRTVQFEKTYLDQGTEYSAPVQYDGDVNPDGTSISGTWRLPHYSGAFTMKRSI